MPSPTPRTPIIEVEDMSGKTVSVTLVRFLLVKVRNIDDIESIGSQLYSMVEDANRTNLLLDHTTVEYVASFFLGKLIGLRRRVILASGRLVLVVKPGSLVEEIIDLCDLRAIFEIYSTVEEALSRF